MEFADAYRYIIENKSAKMSWGGLHKWYDRIDIDRFIKDPSTSIEAIILDGGYSVKPKTPEYTMAELTEKLGHEFKLIKE